MQNRLTTIIIGLVLILGIGSLVYKNKKPTPPTQQPPTSGADITLSQIVAHNSRVSCWSAINGNVYDLTSWIPYHPGGEQKILSLCGIDGSNTYNAKHGGQSKQAAILAGFKIGILAK